ncbi:MAG: hypothetical protein ACPGYT_11915 [Nitrospirales bacterium]
MEGTGELTLATLGDGGAEEIFQRELAKVLQNIKDPNTDGKVVRSIVMTVLITPNEQRTAAPLAVSFKTKLAPEHGAGGQIFLKEGEDGTIQAITFNPNQMHMFDHGDSGSSKVVTIGK